MNNIKTKTRQTLFSAYPILVLAFTIILTASLKAQNNSPKTPVKNIVLVHGAFLDGSGWEGVYQILVKKGYHISIAQHPLQSFESDIAAVNRIIDQQDGPCILVGHSYGGVIISQTGNHSKVAGLVYIAAHAPEANEKRESIFQKFPPAYHSLIKGNDGYDYIDPNFFPTDFAADLPLKKARYMANAQVRTAHICFTATIDQPAWKTKPSWYLVASADRIINPDLERFYAKRMNSKKTVEIKGASHAVYASRARQVAALIEEAAKSAISH